LPLATIEPVYVVIAQSGRALASSAWRAGIPVVTLDLFADWDTRQFSQEAVNVGGEQGLDAGAVFAALARIEASGRIAGIVAGSGFEDRTGLLQALAERWMLFGNSAEIVRRSKSPREFFKLLAQLGIPHPETVEQPENLTGRWLLKRVGGSSGEHVIPISEDAPHPCDGYFQRYVAGSTYSLVFLADGQRARAVGFNQLWHAEGFPETPFKYGGAVTSPGLAPDLIEQIEDALQELVPRLGLRGLCGLDFMVDGEGRWFVLEVNPRPTATFELHEQHTNLFRAHLLACQGSLPESIPLPDMIQAQALMYARESLEITVHQWLAWSADRPVTGTLIQPGEPICTVFAQGEDASRARRLVLDRLAWLERKTISTSTGEPT
jgi:predicted ATP-grasp superfamily ATP-dependent carboligase